MPTSLRDLELTGELDWFLNPACRINIHIINGPFKVLRYSAKMCPSVYCWSRTKRVISQVHDRSTVPYTSIQFSVRFDPAFPRNKWGSHLALLLTSRLVYESHSKLATKNKTQNAANICNNYYTSSSYWRTWYSGWNRLWCSIAENAGFADLGQPVSLRSRNSNRNLCLQQLQIANTQLKASLRFSRSSFPSTVSVTCTSDVLLVTARATSESHRTLATILKPSSRWEIYSVLED